MLTFAGPKLRAAYPAGLLPLLVLIFSIPHYGATLLRVYERPEDRGKYAFFSVHLTALVAVLFVIGVYDNLVGSLMITVYLTWSPRHYTGQNYGITLMFPGRRGAKLSHRCKRFLHLSFEYQLGYRRALEDGALTRAEASAHRLGRDSAEMRSRRVTLEALNGDSGRALASAQAAVGLHRSAASLSALSVAHQGAGRHGEAMNATFRAATLGGPADGILNQLPSLLVNGASSPGWSRTAALKTASDVVTHFEDRDARALRVAVLAYAAAGEMEQARGVADRASDLAIFQRKHTLAANLRSIRASLP